MSRSRLALLSILFLAVLPSSSHSQDHLPRIAVMPFAAAGVSEGEAEAIAGLFEVSLAETGAFWVIERSRVRGILEAQEPSLSDCPSSGCAVRVGQLLGADQVALASFTVEDGRVILDALVVDVARGIDLQAGRVARDSLSTLGEEAKLLAHRLATSEQLRPPAPGSIRYNLPAGVRAEIRGGVLHWTVEGSGVLFPVPQGRYVIRIQSDEHEPYEGEVMVAGGTVATVNPALSNDRDNEARRFGRWLDATERQLSDPSTVSWADVSYVAGLKDRIRSARFSHPEILVRTDMLLSTIKEQVEGRERRQQLGILTRRQAELERRLNRVGGSPKARALAQWMSLGTGAAGLVTSGVLLLVANAAYQDYLDATVSSKAVRYRQTVTTSRTGMYVGLSLGGAGIGSSLHFWAARSRAKRDQAELFEVRERIRELQGGAK